MNGEHRHAKPWTVVGLLALLYAISWVDRMILALLIDPIQAYTAASDDQMASMFGGGFAIFYVAAGIPIAHMADRSNRARLIVYGVLLWSLTTIAAACARTFAALAVTRAGVAIGEAVLTPVAVSMIADLFPHGRHVLPSSVYTMVDAVMGSGSLIVGGAAVGLAAVLTASSGVPAWRLTFVIVALPGLLAAAAFAWLVREPMRREESGEKNDRASARAAMRHMADNAAQVPYLAPPWRWEGL